MRVAALDSALVDVVAPMGADVVHKVVPVACPACPSASPLAEGLQAANTLGTAQPEGRLGTGLFNKARS
jgi:hypothetical protein